jgi:hypothetical protein
MSRGMAALKECSTAILAKPADIVMDMPPLRDTERRHAM